MSKIYVSAGHGGSDPGAVAGGLLEKNYNLLIANRLAVLLKAAGHEVLRDRTSDKQVLIDDKVKTANLAKVDAFLDIHLNAGGGTGCEVYHHYGGGTGKTLAEKICAEIAKLGFPNRGPKIRKNEQGRDYFGVIRMTDMPAVLIECCFLDSKADMERLDTDRMAEAIIEGVLKVYPAPKAPPVSPPAPSSQPAPNYKVGDVVKFKGGLHYPSSTSSVSVGGNRRPGSAKITHLNLKGRHPYHVVGIGNCNVYGWVDKSQIQ